MEFYSDGKGHVTYEGLSVFSTEKKGSYSGNVLGSQEYLATPIKRWIGEDVYQRTHEAVTEALKSIYGNIYHGYLGVDMIVYKTKGRFVCPSIPVSRSICAIRWEWSPSASVKDIWLRSHWRFPYHL